MKNHKVIFVLLGTIFLFFSVLTVVSAGIYQFGWSGSISRAVVRVIPLPSAIVNGRVVTVSRVFAISEAYKHLMQSQTALAVPMDREMILSGLIENEVARQLAVKNGVTISSQDQEDYYNYVLKRTGWSGGESSSEPRDKFGLSEKQFKNLITNPDFLKQKLQIALFDLDKENNPDYQSALSLRTSLTMGSDKFDKVAENRSEDEKTSYIGGDLGFLSLVQIEPWLRDVAKILGQDEVSEILTTPEGFIILSLDGKTEANGELLFHLRKILIKSKPLVEDVISEGVAKARVYRMKKL